MILWDSISLHDMLLFLNAATMQKRGAGNACSPYLQKNKRLAVYR